MSKVLTLGFEYEHDYTLIAINSTLEDYRLAYFLNSIFNIKLVCEPNGLNFNDKNCSFNYYGYECNNIYASWSLLANKHSYTSINSNVNDLFKEESKTNYLINEKKNIDYFLKINGDANLEELELVQNIKKIKGVITSYLINPKTLKSKDYLIF